MNDPLVVVALVLLAFILGAICGTRRTAAVYRRRLDRILRG